MCIKIIIYLLLYMYGSKLRVEITRRRESYKSLGV